MSRNVIFHDFAFPFDHTSVHPITNSLVHDPSTCSTPMHPLSIDTQLQDCDSVVIVPYTMPVQEYAFTDHPPNLELPILPL